MISFLSYVDKKQDASTLNNNSHYLRGGINVLDV